MNADLRKKIFYAISIMVFAAGIISALTAIRNTADTLSLANRGHRSYTQLTELLEEHNKNQALLELLETALEPEQPGLSSLLEPYTFENNPDIRERPSRDVYPPYFIREVEIIFKDTYLKDVASFINAVEKLTMPWMLVEYHATATGAEPGKANVIIILRTIARSKTPETAVIHLRSGGYDG